MSLLTVGRLHRGLELQHGMEAAYLSDKSGTSFIYLVSAAGLPLHVGWFDNRRKAGGYFPNMTALTTYPETPHTINHRFIVSDQPEGSGRFIDMDSDGYLEGYDDSPTFYANETLDPAALDQHLRRFTLGACVLTAEAGSEFDRFGRQYDDNIPRVREYGQALIAAGNYLTMVDDAMLHEISQMTLQG